MRLTKAEREGLRDQFDGRCAYCGNALGERWHADHVDPVIRETKYERGRGLVPTGAMLKPHKDCLENILPSCAPCNISKGTHSLEGWRIELGRVIGILNRNYPTYRTARRFGLVAESSRVRVEFFFEREPHPPEGKR